jgi:hypothetical protein
MDFDLDALRGTVEETLVEGFEEILGNVTDDLKTEVAAIALDAAEAAAAGDTATLEELATQSLLVGEINRLLAEAVAREKAQTLISTVFKHAMKVALIALV